MTKPINQEKDPANTETSSLDQVGPADRLEHLRQVVAELMEQNRDVVEYQGQSYVYHQPSPKAYRLMQWLWDSCFHAIAMAHIDPDIAVSELRSLLVHQFDAGPDEGMIPHMRFWHADARIPEYRWQDRSWISNPPVLGIAAVKVAEQLTEKDALSLFKELFPALERFHLWFEQRRDLDSDGLVVNIHPWETGRDAATAWDALMPVPGKCPAFINELFEQKLRISPQEFVAQLKESKGPNYVFKDDLHRARLILNEAIKLADCDASLLREAGSFCVQAADYNSIRAADLEALAVIAEALDHSSAAQRWSSAAERTRQAVRTLLWDSKIGTFRDAQLRSSGNRTFLGTADSASAFITFIGKVPNQEQAARLLERLLDPKQFWTKYPMPSESLTAGNYDPTKYWRGNVWPSVQWLTFQGLAACSFEDPDLTNLAHRAAVGLAESLAALVAINGPYEHFNPETGAGQGEARQSWAGVAVALDMYLRSKESE